MSGPIVPPRVLSIAMVAILAAPFLVKNFRPAARRLGDELEKFGRRLRESADEGTGRPARSPNSSVNKATTDTASPAGRMEVEQSQAASIKGDTEVPTPPETKKSAASTSPRPPQPKNPKRTTQSPAKPTSRKKDGKRG